MLLYIVRKCLAKDECEDVTKKLPVSIHSVANQCHLVHHVIPPPYSEEYKEEREIKVEASKDDESNDESVDDGLNLEVINDIECRANRESLVDMCGHVEKWCRELESRVNSCGVSHVTDPVLSREACVAAARPENSIECDKADEIRMLREVKAVEDGDSPATMYGHYSKYYCSNMMQHCQASEVNDLGKYIKYPDDIVYPANENDDDEE